MALFQGITTDPPALVSRYQEVRQATERLCGPLGIEDYVIQAMKEVSPAKWHLAHVSWFFETFLLKPCLAGYRPFAPEYQYLYNSYYNAVGSQYNKFGRGLLSRPTVSEIYEYRAYVDHAMLNLIETTSAAQLHEIGSLITLGLNHEQQHQELLLTDIKYNLSVNPLRPAYRQQGIPRGKATVPITWFPFEGGLFQVGHDGVGFAFDNEWSRHKVYLRPYGLASRLVTNGEYLEFIDSGGYRNASGWLDDGWKAVQEHGWCAPLYWEQIESIWWIQTLSGMQPVDEYGPVCHVSYYEADAYARWKGERLPTEQEWEHAAEVEQVVGNMLESGHYHPLPALGDGSRQEQMFGDVWEWTQSPYGPYPGFLPSNGGLGEYNGKFMVNQMVLRGGSCVTPQSHIRATYRNFFPPDTRWQFSGIRLAEAS